MNALPRILCIGAQKAGTSWLHENLALHPQVWVPPFKELHFFDYKFVEDSKGWAKWHVRSNIRKLIKAGNLSAEYEAHLKSLTEEPFLNGNWYKRVFSQMPAGMIGLDVTPEYCSLPEEGISFVRKFLKEPAIIYIIREPVDRALSQIKMNMRRKNLPYHDLDSWMQAVDDPVVMSRGDYSSYIPRWDSSGLKVLYLPFSQIGNNPSAFLKRIENFCGIDSAIYPKSAQRVFASEDIDPPDKIVSILEEKLAHQVEFLTKRFGADFERSI